MKTAMVALLVVGLVAGATASCFDFAKDGEETDVDCGGSLCWSRCSIGNACAVNADCESGNCANNICAAENVRSRFLAAHATGSGHDHDHDHDPGSGAAPAPGPSEASDANTQSISMAGAALAAALVLRVAL